MERHARGVVGRRSKEGRATSNTGWSYEQYARIVSQFRAIFSTLQFIQAGRVVAYLLVYLLRLRLGLDFLIIF